MDEQICTSTNLRGLGKKTREIREHILAVAGEMGKPFTVRQMFYQLSSRGLVPKTEKQGYRPVQQQLLQMRRARLIPYLWIADSTRWMRKPESYRGLEDYLEHMSNAYRADLWHKLDVHVEVWCEKDALAGVILPTTVRWDVPLMVARGYSSESFAYEAAMHIQETGKQGFVYYVGDFDPSGWQMAENLRDKLLSFGADIDFIRLGVNEEHLHMPEYQHALRPSKLTDARTRGFFERFGDDTPSLELDAVAPDKLRSWIADAIESHVDEGSLYWHEKTEEVERESLRSYLDAWPRLRRFVGDDDETDFENH